MKKKSSPKEKRRTAAKASKRVGEKIMTITFDGALSLLLKEDFQLRYLDLFLSHKYYHW